jgi:UDP-N-acetylmuramate dehydrogenase
VRGTVVLLHSALKQITIWHEKPGAPAGVYAEAGVTSPKVARFAAMNGFEGAEFLAGIPGTVGGALAMNAGCYGAETWQHVTEVLTIDCFGELRRRLPQDFDIGYRHVSLKEGINSEWFVAAWFAFKPGDGEMSRKKIQGLLEKRVASQPIGTPNAGSVFRNPLGDHAARLIEVCGLKGTAIGGAMVSPKHANFIVNAGGATAAEIEAMIVKVRQTVRKQHGVELVTEVRVIGEEQKHAS